MSQIKTLNGVQYTLPQYNDTGWGANTGNVLTQYLAAIADVTLQLSGGSFTLTADVDFGANFGLKALFLKSETTNPASAGVVRLAKTDSIKWRNNANGADIALTIDGSDNLTYAATKVLLSGAVVNADINASAAIAYSKLALTGAILNADLAGSIAYSKLTLTGSIVNGDLTAGTILNTAINASAAIALTKLAALSNHSRALASDSSGFIVESAVTATELGYVSGVTSAIQTQLNATVANPLTADLNVNGKNLTSVLSISFSNTATGGITGTTTNDSAASGKVGEVISASVTTAANTGSTGQWADVTSLSLTAGQWDVFGVVTGSKNTATWTRINCGLGTASGNSNPTGGLINFSKDLNTWASSSTTPVNSTSSAVDVFKLSGTTTVYLKVSSDFSGGQPQATGYIIAIRRR